MSDVEDSSVHLRPLLDISKNTYLCQNLLGSLM